MRRIPSDLLPLKDLVFRILVVLTHGEQHGASFGSALDEPGASTRVLPGHLYRTLDRMLDDGLIEERDQPARARPLQGKRGAQPSRFFRLTPLGRNVVRAETKRLEALIAKSREGLLHARR